MKSFLKSFLIMAIFGSVLIYLVNKFFPSFGTTHSESKYVAFLFGGLLVAYSLYLSVKTLINKKGSTPPLNGVIPNGDIGLSGKESVARIEIQEEKIKGKSFNEFEHLIRINGVIKSSYFIEEGTEGDYVENNKRFLQDFLLEQDKFPLYLTFFFIDDYEDIKAIFDSSGIEYKVGFLEEFRTYWTPFKKVSFHPPYFSVKIPDTKKLKFVLQETYWLPAQNEFYSISTSEYLSFRLENVMEWGKLKERSVPIFNMNENTTFMTIAHDGKGFYLFSNEEKFASIDSLCSHLPKGTVITQINDNI